MAKKGSEKLKCNDLFFFYSILPPKKWGKTIESLLTFPKIEILGLNIHAFVKIRNYILKFRKAIIWQTSGG